VTNSANVNWLAEDDLVYGQSDDVSPSIAACAGIGNLIEEFEDRAAMDIAREICHVRSH
jgi:hypothetical protein